GRGARHLVHDVSRPHCGSRSGSNRLLHRASLPVLRDSNHPRKTDLVAPVSITSSRRCRYDSGSGSGLWPCGKVRSSARTWWTRLTAPIARAHNLVIACEGNAHAEIPGYLGHRECWKIGERSQKGVKASETSCQPFGGDGSQAMNLHSWQRLVASPQYGVFVTLLLVLIGCAWASLSHQS